MENTENKKDSFNNLDKENIELENLENLSLDRNRNSNDLEKKNSNSNLNSNENAAFNYTYNKSNKFPNSKKEFFQKAFEVNKPDNEESLIQKNDDDFDDEKKPNTVKKHKN